MAGEALRNKYRDDDPLFPLAALSTVRFVPPGECASCGLPVAGAVRCALCEEAFQIVLTEHGQWPKSLARHDRAAATKETPR